MGANNNSLGKYFLELGRPVIFIRMALISFTGTSPSATYQLLMQVSGSVLGTATGTTVQDFSNCVLTGSLSGSLIGLASSSSISVSSSYLSGSASGSFTGSFTGTLSGTGSFTGTLSGSLTGTLTGSVLGTASVSVSSSYALMATTASQGSKAWGCISYAGGAAYSGSLYACSASKISIGQWGITFSSSVASVPYAVNINAFSGSPATASIAYSINQSLTAFTMSFATITVPTASADFTTASFNVHSY